MRFHGIEFTDLTEYWAALYTRRGDRLTGHFGDSLTGHFGDSLTGHLVIV